MITPAFLRTMAAYNTAMNIRLYAAAAGLPDAARRLDRGAFWRSIHGTLSHLVWADQMWMSRFDGWAKPTAAGVDSGSFMTDFAAMAACRADMDARLQEWAARVDPDWLAGDLHWFSGAAQRAMRQPVSLLVVHLFNHQTHHRGQAHAMLTAAGAATGDTDIWLVL